MKITFIPKTPLGKWSIKLIMGFLLFLSIFFLLVHFGERGGSVFFSNLKLTVPILLAAISGIFAFFTGIACFFKEKEFAILTFLATLMGFIVLYWTMAEILFPH